MVAGKGKGTRKVHRRTGGEGIAYPRCRSSSSVEASVSRQLAIRSVVEMTSGQLHIQPQHTMEVGNSNQVG